VRPTVLRIVTAIWGFWFAAAFLELPGVHACAVHAASHAQAHQHEHHGAPSHDGKQQQCTCLGHCCGTTPAVLSATVRSAEATETPCEAVVFHAPSLHVVERPHARPFANGPPVV
jgi:hypothetical protein